MERGRLPGLDALRGLAAVIVLFGHALILVGGGDPLHLRHYLAVDLFFAISGYVMARTYEARMKAGELGIVDFLGNRYLRLWPTMAIGAILGAVVFQSPHGTNLIFLAMGIFWVPLLRHGFTCFPQNLPTWSIFFEYFANIAHALLLVRLSDRALALIAGCSLAVLAMFAPDLSVGWGIENFWLGMPRVLASYCIGVVLYRRFGDGPRLPFEPAAILLILWFGFGTGMASKWMDLIFVTVGCPLIVLSGLSPPRYLAHALKWLGAISFPLYAIHTPLLAYLVGARGWNPGLAAIATLLAATIVGRATNIRVRNVLPWRIRQKSGSL